MVSWKQVLAFSPALVLANSMLGLSQVLDGFFDVWAASLLGDLIFIAGTTGVAFLAWGMLTATSPALSWLAAPAVFFANWTTYVLAWMATGSAMLDEWQGWQWSGILETGWPGLVAGAVAALVAAFVQAYQRRARAETGQPAAS